MLHYTGHPFIDVGIAAITAFSEKSDPAEVTNQDLEQVVDYIEKNYIRPPLQGHLTMAFTSNAWFIQNAYNPDKTGLSAEERTAREATRKDWAARHLRQWQVAVAQSPTEVCVFTGKPAIDTTLSGKLPQSRAGRAQVPLLQGDDAINFFTYGASGLPISGVALLALQFFPMGCAKCGVGLLAVHSDNDQLTYAITRKFLKHNQDNVTKAQIAKEDKLPGTSRSLKTLLIETLQEVERQRKRKEPAASLTAYNFNNGKTPSLELYHLPLEIVSFLQIVNTTTYHEAWQQITNQSWDKPKKTGTSKKPRYNILYEDIFRLPDNSLNFVRKYFLRNQTLRDGIKPVPWLLVQLFLEKVVLMEVSRITKIKEFGDRLADYIEATDGEKFFRALRTAKTYNEFQQMIIYTSRKAAQKDTLLINFDDYIKIFEEIEDENYGSWKFARNLVLIRIIERLYEKQWIQTKDFLEESPDEEALLKDEEV